MKITQQSVIWLNHSIKHEMLNTMHLYDQPKLSNLQADWEAYWKSRNKLNNMLDT